MVGGVIGYHAPNFFAIVGFSEIYMLRWKILFAFAVGKDKGFESYQEIIELSPPSLRVP